MKGILWVAETESNSHC